MTTHEFINRIRSLWNIDHDQLPKLTAEQWPEFRDNPPRYLMHTDKVQAEAIIREVEKRQKSSGDAIWQPIATAPKDEWIEVCGDSGYSTVDHFIAVARHNATYRPLNPWRNVQNDALSDCGWTPLFWRKLSSVPQVR